MPPTGHTIGGTNTAKVRLRDLDAALAPHRQALRCERPPLDRAGCYRVAGGRIVRDQQTRDGPVDVPLANRSGRIVEGVLRDDGAERQMLQAIEGAMADGTPLPRVESAAEEFAALGWPVARWGTRDVIYAGLGTRDHLRAALLSGDASRRIVYAHLGWRELGGAWAYLHAAGSVGADGPAPGVEVALPDALAGYLLPPPPDGAELTAAVRASLRLLDLAPDRITAPLLGAAYRAVLGPADYALHLAGPTGVGKSELAALAQQNHGAELDARRLPGSWSSTGNALESVAFAAKDALLAVDDFAPAAAPPTWPAPTGRPTASCGPKATAADVPAAGRTARCARRVRRGARCSAPARTFRAARASAPGCWCWSWRPASWTGRA
jgi:hypothetical protein